MSILFSHRCRISRLAVVAFFLLSSLPRLAAAQAQYHILEKGETLYSVARAYGVKPELIAAANSIDDPSKLRAGKKLIIPGDAATAADDTAGGGAAAAKKTTHKVVKGETLYSIAKTFGVGLDALMAANKLAAASVIKAGDTLMIPSGGKPRATAVSTTAAGQSAAPAMPDAVKTSAKATSAALSWPCPGDILYLDGKAYGVVIKAKLGEVQRAIADGTVSSAGPYRGYGNVVFVLSHGFIYVYGGNEGLSVRAGDQVKKGQELGKIGMDSKQGGPTAYFLVFKNGSAIDPATAPRD